MIEKTGDVPVIAKLPDVYYKILINLKIFISILKIFITATIIFIKYGYFSNSLNSLNFD